MNPDLLVYLLGCAAVIAVYVAARLVFRKELSYAAGEGILIGLIAVAVVFLVVRSSG